MRWEDERYVRTYVRDTPGWILGPWQARACLHPILRKLDRAGLYPLGEDGIEGLAAVIMLPLEVVQVGLDWWLSRKTFEVHGEVLVMPKFIEAQEATQSDVARQRARRERARAEVTKRDVLSQFAIDESQTVTNGHDPSHAVTNGHDLSLCAVPSVLCRTEETKEETLSSSTPEHPSEDAVRLVFDYWAQKQADLTHTSVDRLKFTSDRKTKIRARLAEKYTVDDLKRAIDGCLAKDFNVQNHHTDLTLICRSASYVDRYQAERPEDPQEGSTYTEVQGGKKFQVTRRNGAWQREELVDVG